MFDINEAREILEKLKNYKMPPSQPRFLIIGPKFINKMLSDETTKKRFISMCEGNHIKEVYSVNIKGVILAKFEVKDGKLISIKK